MRAALFGFCDGLVSNCCLVIGVFASLDPNDSHMASTLLITAIAGLAAGATSMAAGEWISMTAQEEAQSRELRIERRHIMEEYDLEAEELKTYLVKYGVSKAVADLVERDMRNSDNPVDSMLSVHAALELGIDTSEVEGAAPTRAALFSFGTFSVGAAIPMLPWLVVQILNRMHRTSSSATLAAFGCTIVLSAAALFAAGALLCTYTGRMWWWSGARQLGVGALAAVFSMGVGWVFGTTVA